MPSPASTRRLRAALVAGLAVLAAGCTTVLTRNPVPEEAIERLSQIRPYGIEAPGLREWGDMIETGDINTLIENRVGLTRERYAEEIARGETVYNASLALSGGGPDGAFGAGLLKGWTDRGDRPEFRLVNGISTGAIIALFAFLGPKYDGTLEEIYTTYTTDQLLTPAIFAGLTGGTALTDTRGFRRLIDTYLTEQVMREVAEAYREGRVLLIGTTNLDAARPVTWNMGAIAASGHPDALTLMRDIIQASSAIPAAFPPVLVPVEANGRAYDEMHVDGGATQQVALFSPQIPIGRIDRETGLDIERDIFVVINNKLQKPYDPVRPRVLSIAGTAVSSLLSGSGSGDVYRIFAIAQRDDIDMRVTWIPQDFDKEPESVFDPVYMRALYDLGYEVGVRGPEAWPDHPPDFVFDDD